MRCLGRCCWRVGGCACLGRRSGRKWNRWAVCRSPVHAEHMGETASPGSICLSVRGDFWAACGTFLFYHRGTRALGPSGGLPLASIGEADAPDANAVAKRLGHRVLFPKDLYCSKNPSGGRQRIPGLCCSRLPLPSDRPSRRMALHVLFNGPNEKSPRMEKGSMEHFLLQAFKFL